MLSLPIEVCVLLYPSFSICAFNPNEKAGNEKEVLKGITTKSICFGARLNLQAKKRGRIGIGNRRRGIRRKPWSEKSEHGG